MKSVRIEILNQVYDEIEVKLKDSIKEKEYLLGNQFRWFTRRVTIPLNLRNLPKILL